MPDEAEAVPAFSGRAYVDTSSYVAPNQELIAMAEQIAYAHEPELRADEFLDLVQQVWPGTFSSAATATALRHTINLTARAEGRLVGCARLLTDGYFFSTVTEILVAPAFRRKGIGSELMRRAVEASPCTLSFG